MNKTVDRIWGIMFAIGGIVAALILQIIALIGLAIVLLTDPESGVSLDSFNATEFTTKLSSALTDTRYSGIYYIIYVAISLVVLGIVYWLMVRYYVKKHEPTKLAMRIGSYVGGLVAFGIAIQMSGSGMLSIFTIFFGDTKLFMDYTKLMEDFGGMNITPLLLVYTFFGAPIIEEILFRGIILEGLRKGFKDSTAVIVSAVMFGIFHMNVIQGVYAALFGVCFGYVKIRRNNLKDSILLHMVVNSSGTLVGILTALASGGAGELTSYILMAILGTAICVIWFINQEEDKKIVQKRI